MKQAQKKERVTSTTHPKLDKGWNISRHRIEAGTLQMKEERRVRIRGDHTFAQATNWWGLYFIQRYRISNNGKA